jgi:hypothetical protein
VALIEIPPFVLADEDPPGTTTPVRTFHVRSYQIEAVEFPREVFSEVLGEHARLLEAHAPEILAAPLDHPGNPADDRFVALEDLHTTTTLLVSDGAAHEAHKWRTVDLSYVVQRCPGIVRRLMEVPPEEHTYVVVVARGVASLHLLRGVEPRRAGELARLEVVARALVVEPWDQWRQREGQFVTTWWRTPIGELVASRRRVREQLKDERAVADALMTIRGQSVHERLATYAREEPGSKPLALLDASVRGESIEVVDRRGGDPFVDPFPGIVAALRVKRPGFVPVLVYAYHWAVLCWIALDAGADVAVPEALVAKRPPQPDDGVEDDEQAPLKPRTRRRPSGPPMTMADEFPPLDPWEPSAKEVHALWRAALWFAAFVVGLAASIALLVLDPARDLFSRVVLIAAVAFAVLGFLFMGFVLRLEQLNIDPARRKQRWEDRKQMIDEEQAQLRPAKQAPPVLGRKYWMRKLAQRLSRLERLVTSDAPETIIEADRKLIRDAIAQLDESDAKAVLAAWPVAAGFLEPRGAEKTAGKRRGTDKPN